MRKILSTTLIIAIMTLWFPQQALAAVTVDATSVGTGTSGDSVDNYSWSHTVGSGDDKVLLVGVYFQDVTASVSSVTFNGESLTNIRTQTRTNNQQVSIWGLINPDTTTANIVVTFDENILRSNAGAVSFFGADQGSFGGASNDAANNTGSPSVSLTTTEDNSVVFTIVGGGNTDISGATGTNQTDRFNALNFASSDHDVRGSTQTTTTAGSYTQSFGGGQVWNIASYELQPAAEAAAPEDIIWFF